MKEFTRERGSWQHIESAKTLFYRNPKERIQKGFQMKNGKSRIEESEIEQSEIKDSEIEE